jgi:oxygen-independent coproporphyrinogen-3 oxidase
MSTNDLAVYFHFLYCKSRCPYCDFFRALKPREFDEEAFVQRYLQEVAAFSRLLGKRHVGSIYFGGGTPSLLTPKSVETVINAVQKHFDLDAKAEITLEVNPNTFEQEKFRDFKTAGVNRLSLGVQALNERDLKFLGRTHSLTEAVTAIEYAKQVFERVNFDLIYVRPGQSWASWQEELDSALALAGTHLSLYQLSIEEGTVFAKRGVKALDEDDAASLYEKTVLYLREHGFERYEVSNFAKSDAESRHNMVYWQGGDYIGCGEGAHGRVHVKDKIYATVDGKIAEELTPEERAEELILMGLRIKDGIDAEAFYQACGIKIFDFLSKKSLERLAKLNLLCYDACNIRLTDKGFLLLDEVVLELVS